VISLFIQLDGEVVGASAPTKYEPIFKHIYGLPSFEMGIVQHAAQIMLAGNLFGKKHFIELYGFFISTSAKERELDVFLSFMEFFLVNN
jgi:hypothetical protein